MKKIYLFIMLISLSCFANPVLAAESIYGTLYNSSKAFSPYMYKAYKPNYNTGLYIGADYLKSNPHIFDEGLDEKSTQYAIDGGKAVIGYRIVQAFALEAFYSQTENYVLSTDVKGYDRSFTGYGVDGIIYTPIAAERLYLLTSLGWGNYTSKSENKTGILVEEKEESAFRYGFGIELNIDDNFAIRGMYSVINIDGWEEIDKYDEYQIGFRLYF